MRRREFITAIGGAVPWPLTAYAQQLDRVRRIGVLIGVADDVQGHARLAAFQRGLQTLGWVDGRNVQIVARFGPGDSERQTYAPELVRLAPDVILANTGAAVRALLAETKTIPIVFAQLPDPVATGLVSNLTHPGDNITGFTSFEYPMGGKWLELLKEIAPGTARIMAIGGGGRSGLPQYLTSIERAAALHRVQLTSAILSDVPEIERTIDRFAGEPNGGLILVADPIATLQLELFITLAARYRLPAIYPYRYFVTRGGLLSYGVDNLDIFWRAAAYVDRILKGDKPGDLPVQGPTKYELVVNLKTARAIALDVPATLINRADEVIE
jgi:putative tryptophan/tyrosine transport system substrate-binding protein